MLTDRDMSMFSRTYWTKQTMLDYSAKVLLQEAADWVDESAENKDNSHMEETSVIDNNENKQN